MEVKKQLLIRRFLFGMMKMLQKEMMMMVAQLCDYTGNW